MLYQLLLFIPHNTAIGILRAMTVIGMARVLNMLFYFDGPINMAVAMCEMQGCNTHGCLASLRHVFKEIRFCLCLYFQLC